MYAQGKMKTSGAKVLTRPSLDVFYYHRIDKGCRMARDTSKLQTGDLEVLTVVEHIDNPKKYAIMGQFKGSSEDIILARVGEGDNDPRPPETIKTTAECVAKEIVSLYGLNAFLRQEKRGSPSG